MGSDDFDCLSTLVSNHLSSPSNSLINNFQQLKLTGVSDAGSLSKITERLQISDSKSVGNIETKHISKNDLVIDLSVALKESTSLPSMTIHTNKESFEIPYVDCEKNESMKKREQLKCAFDSKNILKLRLRNYKKRSRFGKVICQKYKRTAVLKLKLDSGINIKSKIKHFEFTVPSPDDFISKNLRR